jgi:hypothetical protein
VYSWEKSQALHTNVFYGLAATGLIGVSILFFGSPQTVDRVIEAIAKRTTKQPAIVAPVQEQKPIEQTVVKKTAKPRRTGLNLRSQQFSETESAVASPPTQLPRVQPPAQTESPEASVRIDDAAVYSSNSPNSSVVRRLKKGDVVESKIEVIDSRGRWSLVGSNGSTRSGFVRSEDLEREKNQGTHP